MCPTLATFRYINHTIIEGWLSLQAESIINHLRNDSFSSLMYLHIYWSFLNFMPTAEHLPHLDLLSVFFTVQF